MHTGCHVNMDIDGSEESKLWETELSTNESVSNII